MAAIMDPQHASAFAEIDDIMRNVANMDEDCAIVGMVDKLVALLLSVGLAIYITLPPNAVGIHPRNRYGVGLIVNNVHKLGLSFKRIGFSMAACAGATCVEDSEDGEDC